MDRLLNLLIGQVSALVAQDQCAAAETGCSRVYFYNSYGTRYSYSIYQYQE